MKEKCILVTGGAGLVGSHIVDLLLEEQPAEIRVLDNFTRGRKRNLAHACASGRVTIVEGDLRDQALLHDVLQDVDLVFHQAAIRITQCAEEPRLAVDVLAVGTFNLLEAAVKRGVRKVVAASSASVYGMADQFPTNERHHPYNNRTLYGAAKAFNEGLLASFHEMYGLEAVALRYFNVYGPRMDVHGVYTEVLVRWMERIEAGQPPLVFGSGNQTVDFVHAADIARANLLAAATDVGYDVFNVASGQEVSLNALAAALTRQMGAEVGIEHRPERAVNPVPRRLADTTRAKDVLGFSTRIDLETGLRSLVDWWRAERAEEQTHA